MSRTFAAMAALTFILASSAASAQMLKTADTTKGKTFVDTAGMTLYTFDKDAAGSGKSVCNGQCATIWPPFAAAATASPGGDWTIVTRDDGSKQWAWLGQPLYYWAKDQKPGDVTGDGFNKVWHAVRPEPRPLTGNMSL